MKRNKIKFLPLMIAICMLVGTVPAYATNPFGSVTLTFTSEEDVDLSGIVVSVYEATPTTYTDTYILYRETLSFTAQSNAQGTITFSKPSEYCSFSVDLTSVPSGMGISEKTIFLTPEDTAETMSISMIDHAEATGQESQISATFFDVQNQLLYADYDVIVDDNNYGIVSWQDIDATDTFYITGSFVSGTTNIPFSIPIDVSENNIISKYEVLDSLGVITEDEKIMKQCQALADSQNEALLTWDTRQMIENYRDDILESHTSDMSLQSEMPAMNEPEVLMDDTHKSILNLCDTLLETYTVSSTLSSLNHSIATIWYDSSITLHANAANAVYNELSRIYNFYVTSFGFKPPQNIQTGVETLTIRIAEITGSGVWGSATLVNNSPEIIIDPDGYTNNTLVNTLAHEFMHTIQYAYGYQVGDNNDEYPEEAWAKESCATAAAALYTMAYYSSMYSTYASLATTGITNYFANPTLSLKNSSNNVQMYRSMLYPLYLIFETSNGSSLAVIKKIYEATQTLRATNDPNIYSEIDLALKNINSSYSMAEMFSNFAVSNISPSQTYGSYALSTWGTPEYILCSVNGNTTATTKTEYLAPMGACYFRLADLSDSELLVTIDITRGSYTDISLWGAINNGTQILNNSYITNPVEYTLTGSRYTLQYFHGGSSNYPYFTIVAANTNYSANATIEVTYNE